MHGRKTAPKMIPRTSTAAKSAMQEASLEAHSIHNPHTQMTFQTAIRLLESQNFFNRLKTAGHSDKVRMFEFNGRKFAVKDTRGSEMQGARYEKFREAFLMHQRAVRSGKIKPQKYALRSIKVIKKVGNFLIMNYIEGKPLPKNFDAPEHTALREAFNEMKANMEEMKKGILFYSPQYIDVIVAKEPIAGHPKRTKFVFYLPYDHT